MSFTQDIHILRSTQEIQEKLDKDVYDLADKIKTHLTRESLKSSDGSATYVEPISEIHKEKVFKLLSKWVKIYNYSIEYRNKHTYSGGYIYIAPRLNAPSRLKLFIKDKKYDKEVAGAVITSVCAITFWVFYFSFNWLMR